MKKLILFLMICFFSTSLFSTPDPEEEARKAMAQKMEEYTGLPTESNFIDLLAESIRKMNAEFAHNQDLSPQAEGIFGNPLYTPIIQGLEGELEKREVPLNKASTMFKMIK